MVSTAERKTRDEDVGIISHFMSFQTTWTVSQAMSQGHSHIRARRSSLSLFPAISSSPRQGRSAQME